MRALRRAIGEIGILKMLGEMGAFALFMFAMWALLVLGYALDQSRPRCPALEFERAAPSRAALSADYGCFEGGSNGR